MSSQTAALLFNMAIAIRRLLILVDNRKSAAKFAESILAEADRLLRQQQ